MQLLQLQQLQQRQQQQAQMAQHGVPNQMMAAQKQMQGQLVIQRPPSVSSQSPQVQFVRAPNGQIVIQQNPSGQLVAAMGVQNAQQNVMAGVQMGTPTQAASLRPTSAVVGDRVMVQAYPGSIVPSSMQIRPGYPGQSADMVNAAAVANQQQQQMSRKLYEAQMMRQQEQMKMKQDMRPQDMMQQDPTRPKQMYKMGEASHKAVCIQLHSIV